MQDQNTCRYSQNAKKREAISISDWLYQLDTYYLLFSHYDYY